MSSTNPGAGTTRDTKLGGGTTGIPEISRASADDLPAELAAAFREEAIEKCARPEEFWSRQQAHIHKKLTGQPEPRRSALRFALATAAVVLGAALLLLTPAKRAPESRPQAYVHASDPDQQLLVAVEDAVAAGTPAALEPLTLNVEASSEPGNTASSFSKEQHHEN